MPLGGRRELQSRATGRSTAGRSHRAWSGPPADAIEDLTPKSKTGVEAAGGVLLLQTSGVTAEHERWL
jgi:hypothetical protein